MPNIQVSVNQVGPSTTEAKIRTHHVLIDRPEAKGGEDKGAMGGELLLASLGGCFMSNLLEAIRVREADVGNVLVHIDGTLEGSPAQFTAINLSVKADYRDKAGFEKLVTISERSCIVANTLKGSVKLTFTVN